MALWLAVEDQWRRVSIRGVRRHCAYEPIIRESRNPDGVVVFQSRRLHTGDGFHFPDTSAPSFSFLLLGRDGAGDRLLRSEFLDADTLFSRGDLGMVIRRFRGEASVQLVFPCDVGLGSFHSGIRSSAQPKTAPCRLKPLERTRAGHSP
jgi:hypothetical protein